MNRSQIVFGLVLLSFIIITQSTLAVYNLEALGEKDQSYSDIRYSIANYGFSPFGKTIIAKLMHSPAFSTECSIDPNTAEDYENSFLLIPRGDCEFVTKTLNAQKLGAQLAIIMDDKEHEQMVIMADNGYGYKVNIPSIFINFQDGQKLIKLIDENKERSVMMKITFENLKTPKVDVVFWLQANNRHSYKLVGQFKKYYPFIKDQISFSVVYSSIDCGDTCKKQDCYFNNHYCAINLIHEESATGQLLLNQQIREQIVLKLYPDLWWHYMKYIQNQCGSISELKECGQQSLKSLGADIDAVQKAFKDSFTAQQDNTYLKRSSEILQNAGVSRFPAVTLNGVKLKASVQGQFVFDDICNTLQSPPEACNKYVFVDNQSVVSNEWSTLLLVVLLGILIFSAIFIVYRRSMKKKITLQMQSRVDDMVSKYIEFYSERGGKK